MKWIFALLGFGCGLAIARWGLPEIVRIPYYVTFPIPAVVLDNERWIGFGSCVIGAWCAFFMRGPKKTRGKVICAIKGLRWDLNDFCRGWLITGETGSGKTAAAICHILHQLFRRATPKAGMKPWGGVAVDQKGNFFAIIEKIAANYEATDRLITLQVRPDNAPADWTPHYRYNLLSYPGIPASTYAKMIVDTASSLGQETGGSGNFFRTQAQLRIEHAIDLLRLLQAMKGHPDLKSFEDALSETPKQGQLISDREWFQQIPKFVSLQNVYTVLTDRPTLERILGMIAAFIKSKAFGDRPEIIKGLSRLHREFTGNFLAQPPEQLGGVIATIDGYLSFFTAEEICEVFCAEENSVEFEQVDEGVIFSISMPQKYQTERVYVNTLMKLIYYTHALRRFDTPDTLNENNLLVFIADEAQGVITASKDGMTDYTVVDKIREARATVIFAAQSTTSFLPVMKREQVATLLLNLANQVHFKAADEDNAKRIADTIGKRKRKKRSYSYNAGQRNVNIQDEIAHILEPHELRGFAKFECVMIHPEFPAKRLRLPPIGPDGKIPRYYNKIR